MQIILVPAHDGIALDSWSLCIESWSVIGLRIPRLMAGNPDSVREAQRMVVEKIEAAGRLQWMMLTGDLGGTGGQAMARSIAHYRKAVAKNRRRLD
ncbi:hypothetical protein [Sphingobium sp.]|uniref:hypothetical protein n=1 Tax=Sphingobium sp. TaxID=1912891 RepID=UPI002C12FF07|nr:hypothetical protein [Sphingobium sp.]HUD93667.1 hypothetical protein [Sphingobium sp.]